MGLSGKVLVLIQCLGLRHPLLLSRHLGKFDARTTLPSPHEIGDSRIAR